MGGDSIEFLLNLKNSPYEKRGGGNNWSLGYIKGEGKTKRGGKEREREGRERKVMSLPNALCVIFPKENAQGQMNERRVMKEERVRAGREMEREGDCEKYH